jgi:GH15 family glucan-1,4-alpha-glucosidase
MTDSAHSAGGLSAGRSLNLGMIGNCAFSALIDPVGAIVWCCLPRFDGDPVFNALIDPSANGSLRAHVAGLSVAYRFNAFTPR